MFELKSCRLTSHFSPFHCPNQIRRYNPFRMTNVTPAISDSVPDVDVLEDLLSQPSDGVVETLRNLKGDLIVLGIAGKMGPSLAHMVRRGDDRAGVRRRVIGVSRFSSGNQKAERAALGLET